MAAEQRIIYRFAEFELEPGERRLLGGGKPITLTPKVFDTLVLLVQSAGRLCRKHELLQALWPRGFVDEATLSNHVWQIRRALGDTAKRARFIETVPKLGYRFAAVVEASPAPMLLAAPPILLAPTALLAPAAPLAPPQQPAPTIPGASTLRETPPPVRRRWRVAGLLALLAVALMITVLAKRSPRPQGVRPAAAAPRLMVLAGFSNLSADPGVDWLTPALATMLGASLNLIDNLHVLPYAAAREAAQALPPAQAGGYPPATLAELGKRSGADYILSGTYSLSAETRDPRLRIDLVVQSARNGALLASAAAQGSLSSLNRLVEQSSATLRAALGYPTADAAALSSIATAQPPTPEVARRVGRALAAMDRYDALLARDELLEAVAQAPGYAPAYLYLANAWAALGYREKSLAAAEQAAAHGGALPPEQRQLVNATVQTASYEWPAAAATWSALVALKPAAVEYRIAWADALLAAGDPAQAAAVASQLRLLPEAADDPRATLLAARVADRRNDAKGSAALALQALRQAQARQLPMPVADAELQLAAERAHLGDKTGAQTELYAAIADYQALGNPRGEAEARRSLASVLSDGEAAREEYQRAMALSQGIGDAAGIAAVYRSLSSLLWAAGDRDAAGIAARHALTISRNTGDLPMQAWTLRALATIASDEAATDEVVEQYREVTVLTERSHDAGGHVWSLATDADLERMRGDLQDAAADCSHALDEAAKLSDPQFLIYSSFTCALVAMDRGAAEAARGLLRETARLSQASGNRMYGANADFALGQLALDAGHYTEAQARLEAAAKGFAGMQADTGAADAEALLTKSAQALGNRTGRDRAAARAGQLRAGITSRQEIYGVDIALAQLADNSLQRADAIAELRELAADAARRHWLGWSLEAKLAQWQLTRLEDPAAATALQREIEAVARAHGFGRVLALLH